MEIRDISWDGNDFVYINASLSIEHFAGTTPIRKLAAYPLKFHENQTDLRQRLVARGRKFESLAGMRLMFYKRLAFGKRQNPFGRDPKFVEDGRIVLDAKSYQRHNPGRAISTTPLDADSSEDGKAVSDSTFKDFEMIPDLRINTADLLSQNQSYCFDMLQEHGEQEDREYRRDARDLHSKDPEYYVDDVKDIDWNDRAISSLILPKDYKKLILAFVETQATYREDFDDVIAGKGQGIIMLLAGPPGTGKTLTAESVAEHLRVPLYTMSAGELGTHASSVEERLSDIFDLTADWKAVLLIDEADVFLESRTTRDLERNKLVSVFLRTLEYYRGVLFLTTNRIAAIDEAFESRIHLTIRYPQLDAAARKSVWANFIDVYQDSNSLSDESLTALAEEQISGRQIKNVVKTAQLLARTSKEALAEEHVKTVLRVIKENRSSFHPNDSSGAIV